MRLTHRFVPHYHRRRVGRRATRTSGGYLVTQVAAAYGLPKVVPPRTVPIVILSLGGGWLQSDIDAYFAACNLPAPTITVVSVDGGSNSPGDDADVENVLDICMAGGVYAYVTGQAAKIYVVCSANTNAGYADGIAAANQIAKNLGGAVVYYAAAGDNDSGDGESGQNVDYPASSPNVLGAGGTSLVITSTGGYGTESVWNDGASDGTGGGVSSLFSIPAFQAALKLVQNEGSRCVPDVAANADPNTGYRLIVDGQWSAIGGTSAAAPFWAGLTAACAPAGVAAVFSTSWGAPENVWGAAVQQCEAQFAAGVAPTFAALLYSNPGAFRDITMGNNGAFDAEAGYDCCTGLGTPNGAALVSLLTAGNSAPAPSPTPPAPPSPPAPPHRHHHPLLPPWLWSIVLPGTPYPSSLRMHAIGGQLLSVLLQLAPELLPILEEVLQNLVNGAPKPSARSLALLSLTYHAEKNPHIDLGTILAELPAIEAAIEQILGIVQAFSGNGSPTTGAAPPDQARAPAEHRAKSEDATIHPLTDATTLEADLQALKGAQGTVAGLVKQTITHLTAVYGPPAQ